MTFSPPDITLEDVSVAYSPGEIVLDSVSTNISGGQFVAVVGRSGSGKSSLLKVIGNLIQPSTGRVSAGTQSAEQARIKGLFSFCFQDPVLFGWRTCIKNVELPAEIMHRRGVDALAALRLVGLEGVKDNYPSELSGGMKQRVALARALSYEAQILILDEPFAALDEITRAELNRQLLRLWTMLRFTCIFTTHSVTEAVSLADRVLILSTNKGGIEADIKVDLPRPRTDEVCETPNFLHLVRTIKEGLNL